MSPESPNHSFSSNCTRMLRTWPVIASFPIFCSASKWGLTRERHDMIPYDPKPNVHLTASSFPGPTASAQHRPQDFLIFFFTMKLPHCSACLWVFTNPAGGWSLCYNKLWIKSLCLLPIWVVFVYFHVHNQSFHLAAWLWRKIIGLGIEGIKPTNLTVCNLWVWASTW